MFIKCLWSLRNVWSIANRNFDGVFVQAVDVAEWIELQLVSGTDECHGCNFSYIIFSSFGVNICWTWSVKTVHFTPRKWGNVNHLATQYLSYSRSFIQLKWQQARKIGCSALAWVQARVDWPTKINKLWYSIDDIKKILNQPIPTSTRSVYKFCSKHSSLLSNFTFVFYVVDFEM